MPLRAAVDACPVVLWTMKTAKHIHTFSSLSRISCFVEELYIHVYESYEIASVSHVYMYRFQLFVNSPLSLN